MAERAARSVVTVDGQGFQLKSFSLVLDRSGLFSVPPDCRRSSPHTPALDGAVYARQISSCPRRPPLAVEQHTSTWAPRTVRQSRVQPRNIREDRSGRPLLSESWPDAPVAAAGAAEPARAPAVLRLPPIGPRSSGGPISRLGWRLGAGL